MSWACPVCHQAADERSGELEHLTLCPWKALEERLYRLEQAVNQLERDEMRHGHKLRELDARTLGLLK